MATAIQICGRLWPHRSPLQCRGSKVSTAIDAHPCAARRDWSLTMMLNMCPFERFRMLATRNVVETAFPVV